MSTSYPGLTTDSAPYGDKVSAKDTQIMNENLSQGKVMPSTKNNQFSSDHYHSYVISKKCRLHTCAKAF
jgi:hypothetical protein